MGAALNGERLGRARRVYVEAHAALGVDFTVWERNEWGRLFRMDRDVAGRRGVVRWMRDHGCSWMEIERVTGMGHGGFAEFLPRRSSALGRKNQGDE